MSAVHKLQEQTTQYGACEADGLLFRACEQEAPGVEERELLVSDQPHTELTTAQPTLYDCTAIAVPELIVPRSQRAEQAATKQAATEQRAEQQIIYAASNPLPGSFAVEASGILDPPCPDCACEQLVPLVAEGPSKRVSAVFDVLKSPILTTPGAIISSPDDGEEARRLFEAVPAKDESVEQETERGILQDSVALPAVGVAAKLQFRYEDDGQWYSAMVETVGDDGALHVVYPEVCSC
jgi:hypothetical protein